MVIGELVTFNHNVHSLVQQLSERMTKVEYENTYLRSIITSDPSHDVNNTLPARAPTATRGSAMILTDAHAARPPTRQGYRDRLDRRVGETVLDSPFSGNLRMKTRQATQHYDSKKYGCHHPSGRVFPRP